MPYNKKKRKMIDLSYRDIFGNLRDRQETANSYVISKPGNYCFPLIYGCGIKDSKDNSESYTNQGGKKQASFYDYQDKIIKNPEINYHSSCVEFIVTDSSRNLIQDLKVVNDYIQFSVIHIPEVGGNFVIGLKDRNKKVIWSWHIWLWKEKLENIDIGKHKLLNTNLASKYDSSGKLCNWYYQWGRKDPLCYLDRMINIKEYAESIGQSIQNPNTFFTTDTAYNNNWVKKKFFYNYWNARCYKECVEEPVDKTIYDPCPPGYTVPGDGAFYELSEDKWNDKRKGWLFKENIFLPASGARYFGDGILKNVNFGYYWSANVYDKYSARLAGFDSNDVGLENGIRSYGFSIRPCVAE